MCVTGLMKQIQCNATPSSGCTLFRELHDRDMRALARLNVQIVLNTQKIATLIKPPKNILTKFSYQKISYNRKFQTQKNPPIIRSTPPPRLSDQRKKINIYIYIYSCIYIYIYYRHKLGLLKLMNVPLKVLLCCLLCFLSVFTLLTQKHPALERIVFEVCLGQT